MRRLKGCRVKPLIVEFVGLPGCGKSSVAKAVVAALKKENVIERAELTRHLYRMLRRPRVLFKAILFFLMAPTHWGVKKSVCDVLRAYPLNRERLIYALIFVRFYKNLVKKMKRGKIIVLDEGLVQFISSIPHETPLQTNDALSALLGRMNAITRRTLFVECDLPLEDVVGRLRKRNQDDRFSRVADDHALRALLRMKKRNLDALTRDVALNKLTLDMKQPAAFNADFVLAEMRRSS